MGIEDSITRLFAAQGIRILRQERAPIRLGGETLNMIGIDDGAMCPMQTGARSLSATATVEGLVMPNTVNLLLHHYPRFFDSTELGIDLTLAGRHSRRGQLSLDFIHRGLNLSSLIGVPYTRGMCTKSAWRATLHEPRHRHHRLPHPARCPPGDYGI